MRDSALAAHRMGGGRWEDAGLEWLGFHQGAGYAAPAGHQLRLRPRYDARRRAALLSRRGVEERDAGAGRGGDGRTKGIGGGAQDGIGQDKAREELGAGG